MNDKPVFTMQLTPYDAKSVIQAVNMGIDSRLEGFTKSNFGWDYVESPKLICNIADDHELQILIRRLLEIKTEDAERLADDIIYVQFGHEVI